MILKIKKTFWVVGRNSRKREEIKETKEQDCCCQKDSQQKREGEHKDCVWRRRRGNVRFVWSFDFQEYLLTILIRCEADKESEWETDRPGDKFSEVFGKKRTAYNRRVNFQILEVRKRVSQLLVQTSRIFTLTGYIHRTNWYDVFFIQEPDWHTFFSWNVEMFSNNPKCIASS